MRGVGVVEFGGPEVLRVVELPEEHAGAGQVRVRVHAATVNPTDAGLRNGSRAEALKDVPTPHVPGMDVAGVIDEVGPGTSTDLRVGDEVRSVVQRIRGDAGCLESLRKLVGVPRRRPGPDRRPSRRPARPRRPACQR